MSYLKDIILRDFWTALKARHIWMHMAVRDVKNRYRGTFIGMGWLFLSIGCLTGTIALIYGPLFGMDIRNFLPYLVLGLIIWGFLYSTLIEGSQSFIVAEGYIKQLTFPKQVYILRSTASAAIVGLGGMVVYLVILPLLWPLKIGVMWVVPGVLILLTAGMAHVWIMSYIAARYRDVPHAMSAMLQILYFLTPILYPEEVLAKRGLDFIYASNPFYWLIAVVRYPLLDYSAAPAYIYGRVLVYCVVIWLVALWISARMDRKVVYHL